MDWDDCHPGSSIDIRYGYEDGSPVVARILPPMGSHVDPSVGCPSVVAEFVYWIVNGDKRRSSGEALRGIERRARALLKDPTVQAALPERMRSQR